MKPRQLNKRAIQPDGGADVVIEKLRDERLRNESEPKQPGQKRQHKTPSPRAGPRDGAHDRMTRTLRFNAEQIEPTQRSPLIFCK